MILLHESPPQYIRSVYFRIHKAFADTHYAQIWKLNDLGFCIMKKYSEGEL